MPAHPLVADHPLPAAPLWGALAATPSGLHQAVAQCQNALDGLMLGQLVIVVRIQ